MKRRTNLDSVSVRTDNKENNLKAKIDKTKKKNSKCRMCRKAEENNKHVISKLVQKKREQRRDWFRTYIQSKIARSME